MSFLARLPALANPDTTNSDCAVVALQAMHILRGEASAFLWGSAYQTSVDSFVAAGFFAIFGPTPLALMLSALSLHVVLTGAVFLTLARVPRIGDTRAFALSLVLVASGAAVHSYALYPPRQAALTLGVLALAWLDRATGDARAFSPWLALGAAASSLSLFADPYALVLVPGALVLAAFAALGAPARGARLATGAVGALVGGVPLLLLTRQAGWKGGEASLSLEVLGRNAKLLLSPCGPWAFGSAVYRPLHVADYAPWNAPLGASVVMHVGAVVLVLGAFAAPLFALSSRVDAPTRRLGLAGAAITWGTTAGFLLSVMVMDHFSMRYLAAVVLAAPFAMAPLASIVSPRRVAAAIAPALASGLVGGWASFGPIVDGLRITHLPGHDEERALLDDLARAGVTRGVADYWTSYRLTFLAREALILVPTHTKQDRYAPYRAAVRAASRHVVVVDAYRSERDADAVRRELLAHGPIAETFQRGNLTAFVVEGASGTALGSSD